MGEGIDNILYSAQLHHWWTYGPVGYVCTVYTEHIHFYTTYLFTSNSPNCKTHIHSFWYSSFRHNCGSPATHTL